MFAHESHSLVLQLNQLLQLLKRDVSVLLVSRFAGKILLFVFLLVLANRLDRRAFLDLEVVSSIINFLIWVFLSVTFTIARVGSTFSRQAIDRQLNAFFRHTLARALFIAILCFLAVFAIGLYYDQVRESNTSDMRLILAMFVFVQFLSSYFLGFCQARESYYLISWFYLAPGIVALVAAVPFLYLELGLREALAVYLAGAVVQFLVAYFALYTNFQKTVKVEFPGIPKRIYPGLIRISIGIVIFFLIYSMDIFSAKYLLDPASGETYARLEFLGRILFTIVATVAFVFFVKIVRSFEDKESLKSLMKSVPQSVKVQALAIFVCIFALMPFLYTTVFDTVLEGILPVMLMVLGAKMIQSLLFVVVTFKGATVSRYVLRWLGATLVFQVFLFGAFHESIDDIARNILLSGLFAVVLFVFSFIQERRIITRSKL